MRSDVLSQRIFTAGCLGLPWLWVVHVLYNRGLEASGDDAEATANEGIVDADEHFPNEPTPLSPQQIADVRKSWVSKCKTGAIAVFGFWFLWIILAQVFKHQLPGSIYIRAADDGEWTGW